MEKIQDEKGRIGLNSPFLPEGRLYHTPSNIVLTADRAGIRRAMEQQIIVEGIAVLCGTEHDLTVALGPFRGHIPREETAIGIDDGSTRDIAILSRVGKPVAAVITGFDEETGLVTLSRRAAQLQARAFLLEHARSGEILSATVTHLEPFGAFVDVGCGVCSMIGVENISVARIPHPAARFSVGQEILAVVLDIDAATGRIYLTHKELLGTWDENCAPFSPGMTVPGVIRGLKEYGAFVELTPNLSGLAECRPDLTDGTRVSVYIKSIMPERMKIKLAVIDLLPPDPKPSPLTYFIKQGRLEHWRYAPVGCAKVGAETIFGD